MSETVKITFRLPDGALVEVDAPVGQSVMQAAVFNNVEGVEAECGGSCMCATCHLYADPAVAARLAPPDEQEEAMLGETAAERRPESRLSCQIPVVPGLAGAVFTVPERQS
ncbi:2Fe-2S iron-sulfur cluster-binding protein [Azospirillum sp. ST 5-10]|uniref:2Fe-2S iron-sulfur cluster-binding protein n=1 Tax=unclassified Azospirillum TaxID=2630922 RepID=UPI003F4A271E